MLNSYCEALAPVWLPTPERGRQAYMMSTEARAPVLDEGFEDYTDTVRRLCARAGHAGRVHVTVDEEVIAPGRSQRRPGAHVDGRFMERARAWGHEPPHPAWAHRDEGEPIERMAVIVAADVPGCIVYEGSFNGAPKADGDLEHIRDQLGPGRLLPAGVGYRLSPDCVHESVVMDRPTPRTFLRIALET